VCAIEPNIQCVTTPCAAGTYKTYGNACNANVANAKVEFDGECGKKEGQLVDANDPPKDPPRVCTKEYAPVCGAKTAIEPCLTMPCPNLTQVTYGNKCMAGDVKVIATGECKNPGSPVLELPDMACTQQYDPVCGKDETGKVCITTPCPTHVYKTFGNACGAGIAMAEVVFKGECGGLQNFEVEGEPPVIITTELPQPEKMVSVESASIKDGILSVSLRYGGCEKQHFDLYASSLFLESFPVQMNSTFVPQVEDDCEAIIASDHVYDLNPVRAAYEQGYQTTAGTVILRGLGRYTF